MTEELEWGGVTSSALVVLNDKRSGVQAAADRRMIIAIDDLADSIAQSLKGVEVRVARFRDMEWPEQLRLLSKARVFITTQGSSAFRLVFLPKGATCIIIGAPTPAGSVWQSYHELDRWFPLTYIHVQRYDIHHNQTTDYQVKIFPGHWQPPDPEEAKDWWLYNADVSVRLPRLLPLLETALALPDTPHTSQQPC